MMNFFHGKSGRSRARANRCECVSRNASLSLVLFSQSLPEESPSRQLIGFPDEKWKMTVFRNSWSRNDERLEALQMYINTKPCLL